MARIIFIVAALVLVAHGLVHLIGTVVHMRLGNVQGFVYKTTLIGGRWDLGERGIWLFAALWIVPAVGFVLVALALFLGWSWWQPLLIGVALFSLASAWRRRARRSPLASTPQPRMGC